MLAGPQLVAGPAAPGGERARLLSLYVQDYLECVESLPLDIQRNASLLREMDTQCQGGRRRGAAGGEERGKGTASSPPHMRPARRSRGRGEALLGPRGALDVRWVPGRPPCLGAGGAALPGARPRPRRVGPLPPRSAGQPCRPDRRRCRWRWGAEIGLPAAPPAVRSRGGGVPAEPSAVPRQTARWGRGYIKRQLRSLGSWREAVEREVALNLVQRNALTLHSEGEFNAS